MEGIGSLAMITIPMVMYKYEKTLIIRDFISCGGASSFSIN